MDGNIRWVPPLPAGWEAKYEPTQQRYFFINHSSKQTTWDDPRFSRQPPAPVSPARVSHVVRGRQAAQPQSQNYGYGSAQRQPYHQQQRQAEALPMKHMAGQYVAGQQYQQGALWQQRAAEQQAQEMAQMRARQALQHHYEDDSEEDESIFIEDVVELEVDDQLMHTLREQYPSCPPGKIRSILEKNCNALRASQLDIEAMGFEKVGQSEQRTRPSSHSNEGNYEMAVQRLKREFNQAEITLIRDIIRQCDGDEINAREQLKNLGFQEASPVQEAIPERHRDLASEEREHQRTLSSSSPQRTASPKRPSLSEREKETLITKLCRDFPNLDRTIVELAFETAGSTEDKARHLLQFMYTDNSSSATSPKRTTSPVRQATTSPSRSSAATASNNQSLATTGPSAAESSSRPGSSKSRGGTQSASPPKPTASSSNNALRQQQKKVPKHVTKVKVTGRDQVVTSQQQVRAQRRTDDHYQVFVSNNRTAAKGPDPSLSEGPDLKRVERYGVLPKGPNPDLRKGPNRSLVKGSQGAMGPDPSLRRGPQANLRHGPQADLCRGPAFQKSPTRVLVSNI